tara:strand:+ start:1414 stop:1701 length:288 start_codon:yes stop_codon:yes gene_type:complete
MGTALVGVTSINSEKGFITARSMKDEESADVNNTNAAINVKIESVQADGISKQAIELEKETNVYKLQDSKIADELNKLKAKETDPNFKKYLGMYL